MEEGVLLALMLEELDMPLVPVITLTVRHNSPALSAWLVSPQAIISAKHYRPIG